MEFCNSHLTRNIFNLYKRRFFFGLVYSIIGYVLSDCIDVRLFTFCLFNVSEFDQEICISKSTDSHNTIKAKYSPTWRI